MFLTFHLFVCVDSCCNWKQYGEKFVYLPPSVCVWNKQTEQSNQSEFNGLANLMSHVSILHLDKLSTSITCLCCFTSFIANLLWCCWMSRKLFWSGSNGLQKSNTQYSASSGETLNFLFLCVFHALSWQCGERRPFPPASIEQRPFIGLSGYTFQHFNYYQVESTSTLFSLSGTYFFTASTL